MKTPSIGSKHQRVKQFCDELLVESLEKKKLLHRAKRMKRTLEAEVRFLRQRYEYLLSIQSPTPLPKQDLPRTQACREDLPMERIYRDREALPMDQNYSRRSALPMAKSYRDREASLPNPTRIFDLNQISNEEVELQNAEERLPTQNNFMKLQTSRCSKPPLPPRRTNDNLSSDMKLSVCRDIGKGARKTAKRKISWQDPVAVRV